MKTKIIILGSLMCVCAVLVPVSAASAQTLAQTVPNIFYGRDLTVGSTGSDVALLQGLLSELGYLNVPISIPFGYFGSLTQTALANYQMVLGVTPSNGYFGITTKAAMNSQFAAHGWLALLGY